MTLQDVTRTSAPRRKRHYVYRKRNYSAGRPAFVTQSSGRQVKLTPDQVLRTERLEAERNSLDLAGQLFGDPPPSRSALGRKCGVGE